MEPKRVKTAWFVLASVVLLGFESGSFAGSMRAFSLRQADRMLEEGSTADQNLRTLGGITRITGMVFDRENADVILIGKVVEDLPPATLDDLVVALRCRLLKGQYPKVSIDMLEETQKTKLQEVRFEGGIERTQFGSDFLQSDVILKRYSLHLLSQVQGLSSYLSLYEKATTKQMETSGHPVEVVTWLSEEESRKAVERLAAKTPSESETVQSRFWFHVMDDQSFIKELDDVYLIQELRLGVKAEPIHRSRADSSGKKTEQPKDEVGEEFARQFSEQYQKACNEHPALKRLKLLFELTCIAEGMANLGSSRPALDHLTHKYPVGPVETPEKYPLVQRVGEFHGKGEVTTLVQLSGGIDMEAILLALEDGDVSALKMAVLESRPGPRSLCWTLPLDDWTMADGAPKGGNGGVKRPALAKTEIKPKKLGFSLGVQRFLFDPKRPGVGGEKFQGFPALPAVPPARGPLPKLRRLHGFSAGPIESYSQRRTQRGLVFLDRGNWTGAANAFTDAVLVTPTSAQAHGLLGDAYALSGNLNGAIASYSQAIRLSPNTAGWHRNRAAAYADRNNLGLALADLDEAIRIDPTLGDAFLARALLHARRGDTQKAQQDRTKATQLGLPIPGPAAPAPVVVPGVAAAGPLRSLPLLNNRPLAEGLKSPAYLGAVGGIAFDKVAAPAPGLQVKSLQLKYDPQKPDGRRLQVILNGQACSAAGLPDWQLVPIARFADSPYFAVVSLFGRLADGRVAPSGTKFVVSYHPAFENMLLGLRLVQGDYPLGLTITDDLPRFGNQYLLGPGERAPDPASREPATEVLLEIQGAAGTYHSYVICDARSSPLFRWNNDEFVMEGELYYYYWKRGAERVERFVQPGKGVRLSSGFEIEPLTAMSETMSAQAALRFRANPAVHHSMTNTMRYASFFRYCGNRDARMWKAFLASLDQVPTRAYLVPTPVLIRDLQTAEGHTNLGSLSLNRGDLSLAVSRFTEAIRLDPKYGPAYRGRGLAYLEAGDYGKAVEDFTQAIRVKPDDKMAYQGRRDAYRKMRDFSKALADCETAGLRLIVEVVSDTAPLQVEEQVVATANRGQRLYVMKIHEDWLWIESLSLFGTTRGWVRQSDVK